MTGIREAHPANLSSASQWHAPKHRRAQCRPQSRRLWYIKYPPTWRKQRPVPPGWVQDNREKTWPENLRGDTQAMEGEKVKTAHSPWPRAPAPYSRPWFHGDRRPPERRGRTADSRSKTESLARKVFKVKFSQYLQLEMPKITSRAWARPTHLTHLPCAGLHSQWGESKSPFPLTARRNNIPRMRSLKWEVAD